MPSPRYRCHPAAALPAAATQLPHCLPLPRQHHAATANAILLPPLPCRCRHCRAATTTATLPPPPLLCCQHRHLCHTNAAAAVLPPSSRRSRRRRCRRRCLHFFCCRCLHHQRRYAAAMLLAMPLRCHQRGCGGELMSPFFGMLGLPKIGRIMVWQQNLVVLERWGR
jgi:hypothetical protein